MSLQEIIYRGSLVSTGAAQEVKIPAGFDQFVLRNRTRLAAGAGVVESKYWLGQAAGCASIETLGGGTFVNTYITADGFTYVDTAVDTLGAAVTNVSAINQANPGVVATITPPVAGQIVRIYGTSGMLQIAGMDFTVGTVIASTSFQLAYLNTSGFAAAATAGSFRVVPFDGTVYPRYRFVTAITAAASAVVTFSVVHGFVVGQKLSFRVPAAFGMIQMDGLTGTITAINTTTNTVTVDINSSAFTAFAFPTSAVAANGVSFPIAIPAGEIAQILTGATRDTGTRAITIGSVICGTNLDVMDFWAYRSET